MANGEGERSVSDQLEKWACQAEVRAEEGSSRENSRSTAWVARNTGALGRRVGAEQENRKERSDKMVEIFYDKDVDMDILKGKIIAIIGYGSQGLSLIHI